MKKYYLGARHIAEAINRGRDADCMHDTVSQAVQEAEDRILDGSSDCCVIVKIVKVVRPVKRPIEIIDVD